MSVRTYDRVAFVVSFYLILKTNKYGSLWHRLVVAGSLYGLESGPLYRNGDAAVSCKSVILLTSVVISSAALFSAEAGGDKIAFPENYGKGVKWLVADKPQFKRAKRHVKNGDAHRLEITGSFRINIT